MASTTRECRCTKAFRHIAPTEIHGPWVPTCLCRLGPSCSGTGPETAQVGRGGGESVTVLARSLSSEIQGPRRKREGGAFWRCGRRCIHPQTPLPVLGQCLGWARHRQLRLTSLFWRTALLLKKKKKKADIFFLLVATSFVPHLVN